MIMNLSDVMRKNNEIHCAKNATIIFIFLYIYRTICIVRADTTSNLNITNVQMEKNEREEEKIGRENAKK